MLTIAQQRRSLAVTEYRIVQAELDLNNVCDLIQACHLNAEETLSIRDKFLLAQRALDDLSQTRSFLRKAIELKERDLSRVMSSVA